MPADAERIKLDLIISRYCSLPLLLRAVEIRRGARPWKHRNVVSDEF
jgi:hypothetical protein